MGDDRTLDELGRAARYHLEQMRAAGRTAYLGGAHTAAGYASWEEYVMAEMAPKLPADWPPDITALLVGAMLAVPDTPGEEN